MHEDSICMPFGKYKGVALSDIPIKYLDWMQDRDLKKDIIAYLETCPEWGELKSQAD